MATAPVDICNIALAVHLAARPISDFNDPGQEALLARTAYDETRDEVLRAHPWNFALKRASLVANSGAPEWGYGFAYQTPNDCLRVIEVNGETGSSGADRPGWQWQVENDRVVTDLSAPLEIKYIFRNLVVTSYDSEFVKALSYKLAAEWVEPLVKAANLKETMLLAYGQVLKSAKASDGQEGSPKNVAAYSWLDVR